MKFPFTIQREEAHLASLRDLFDYMKHHTQHTKEKIEEICVHEGRHIDAAKRRGYEAKGLVYTVRTTYLFGRVLKRNYEVIVRFPSIKAKDVSAIALAPPSPSLSDWILGIGGYDVRNLPRDIANKWRQSG